MTLPPLDLSAAVQEFLRLQGWIAEHAGAAAPLTVEENDVGEEELVCPACGERGGPDVVAAVDVAVRITEAYDFGDSSVRFDYGSGHFDGLHYACTACDAVVALPAGFREA